MNRALLALVFLLLQPAISAAPQISVVTVHNGFLKATDYSDMGPNGQRAYAMGLLDGIYIAPYFGAPDNNKLLVRIATCVEGMKVSQVAAIIEKYVRDHPERWKEDLKDVGYGAMLEACPVRPRANP